jgi:hypothetical protein
MSKSASFSKHQLQSITVLRDLGLGDDTIARYLRIDLSPLVLLGGDNHGNAKIKSSPN